MWRNFYLGLLSILCRLMLTFDVLLSRKVWFCQATKQIKPIKRAMACQMAISMDIHKWQEWQKQAIMGWVEKRRKRQDSFFGENTTKVYINNPKKNIGSDFLSLEFIRKQGSTETEEVFL